MSNLPQLQGVHCRTVQVSNSGPGRGAMPRSGLAVFGCKQFTSEIHLSQHSRDRHKFVKPKKNFDILF